MADDGQWLANGDFETDTLEGWTWSGDWRNGGVDTQSPQSGNYGAYFGAAGRLTQSFASIAGVAYTTKAFSIGPSVTPRADLYAARVFGCKGSTNVVVDEIDWAVANGMDVINMSLGSDFGSAENADNLAVANARRAGTLVIAASGNAGPTPSISRSPASSESAVSVAATDVTPVYPTAILALAGGSSIVVQNNNAAPFANDSSLAVVVPRTATGAVSLGCAEAEYDKARNGGIDITCKLVVTLRGTCARAFRAGAGQHYGAAAVAMINVGSGYPNFEGPIPGGDAETNPDDPVTIPFFGMLASDAAALTGPTGDQAPAFAVAKNADPVGNPAYLMAASFSSAGPRFGVTGPGVAISSVASGSGNGFAIESGISMATPHVAGVAALVRRANRSWSVDDQRAALVQAASPSLLRDYSPRLEGAGLVPARAAVMSQAVVPTPDDSVSFGYADLLHDFDQQRQLTIHNDSTEAVRFDIAVTRSHGHASAQLSAPPFVLVAGKSDATITVRLTVPAKALRGTHDATSGDCCLFDEVGGTIQFKPTNSRLNGNVTLTVSYYLAAHARSDLQVSARALHTLDRRQNNLTIHNLGAPIAGTPDFNSLGLLATAPQGIRYADTRAVGVQSIPTTAAGNADAWLVFPINTFDRLSNAAGGMEGTLASTSKATASPNKCWSASTARPYRRTSPPYRTFRSRR